LVNHANIGGILMIEFSEVIGAIDPVDPDKLVKIGTAGFATKEASLSFAPGFISSPMPGDRLVIGASGGYSGLCVAVGGSSPAESSASVDPGERCIFSQWHQDDDETKPVEIRSIVYLNRDAVWLSTKSGKKIVIDDVTGITSIEHENGTTKIQIDATGNVKIDGATIQLNGSSKLLVTHAELNTALQSMVTAINNALATKKDEPGSPGTVTLDISAAKTTTVKTGG